MNRPYLYIFCLAMTACGNNGGGSGSSASSSIPQVITYPKAYCGSKNCLSGASGSETNEAQRLHELYNGNVFLLQQCCLHSNVNSNYMRWKT